MYVNTSDIQNIKNKVDTLKSQLLSIKDTIDSTNKLIQKISIVTQKIKKQANIPQQTFPKIYLLLIEIKFMLSILYKKNNITAHEIKKISQYLSPSSQQLIKLKESFNTIVKNIKKINIEELAKEIYLEIIQEPNLTIKTLKQHLNELHKTCILTQNMLTLYIHNVYQVNISKYRYSLTCSKQTTCYKNLEKIKGNIITIKT